jgi:hypothetical protein
VTQDERDPRMRSEQKKEVRAAEEEEEEGEEGRVQAEE